MNSDDFNSLFEVLSFTEDNLAQALANEFTSSDYIRRVKYHFDFLWEHLKYEKNPQFSVKTILIEHKYISHTYLTDITAEYIFGYQQYPKYSKRVHFFSKKFRNLQELLEAPPKKSNPIWESYRGFVTVKPLPKSRLGPIVIEPYPASTSEKRDFTVLRNYTVELLGRKLPIKSLAFLEQDGIVSACSTVSLWSAIQQLNHLFCASILTPSQINAAAKYHGHVQPTSLSGTGLDIHQICNVLEHINFKAELRTLNGEGSEKKDKSYIRKFIYAYLRSGLPVMIGLDYEDGAKHLVTAVGYKKADLFGQWIKKEGHPMAYADKINEIYAHDDQVGPFARMNFRDYNIIATSTWRKPNVKRKNSIGSIDTIIVPVRKN